MSEIQRAMSKLVVSIAMLFASIPLGFLGWQEASLYLGAVHGTVGLTPALALFAIGIVLFSQFLSAFSPAREAEE